MVVYWHHCLFLDLQAHKVSLPGGANNTWLSCRAHSGEMANYFSLTGEWLLSAVFWCRIGAARCEFAYKSLSGKESGSLSVQLSSSWVKLCLFLFGDLTTALRSWQMDTGTCPVLQGPAKQYPRLVQCQVFWLLLFGMKIPIIFLFLPTWKVFFQ